MAYQAWQATVQDADGNAIPLAEVTVRVGGPAGALATIFSNQNGAAKSNPFFADAEGFAQFFARPGTYYLIASLGGQTTDGWYVSIKDEIFAARADAVAACAAGWRAANGVTYQIGGLSYLGQTGATAIADLPGMVPNGDVTPQHFGAVGDGVADDTLPVQAALNYAVNDILFFPSGNYNLVSPVSGDGTQIIFLRVGATTSRTITTVRQVSYPSGDGAIFRLRKFSPSPSNISPSIVNIASGRGDNTNFIGLSGGFFQVRDEADVTPSTKGVLYGLQLSVVPVQERNNIPFDDVACLVVQNDSTNGSKGTDAIYVGRNTTGSFVGNDFEWTTGMTVGASCGYPFRTTGAYFNAFDAAGRMTGPSNETFGFTARGVIQKEIASNAFLFRSEAHTENSAFTLANLRHFHATEVSIGALSTVTNQYGFTAQSSLVGAINNFGFWGNIPAGAGRWNFFAAGTANNAFAGNVRIGSTTAPTVALDVTGGIRTSRTNVTSPAASDGNVFSGTYTPILVNVSNIDASSASVCQYMRVGNVVTVSGRVSIDPTSAATVELQISLPIPSAINSDQCRGTAVVQSSVASEIASGAGAISGDAGTATALLRAAPNFTVSRNYSFTFTYQIV